VSGAPDRTEPGIHDTWALETAEYSSDRFYTRATDGRGNSELLNFKTSPFVMGILSELVENPEFPDYRTKADVLRDALAHRLRYLQQMEKDPTRMAKLREKTAMLQEEMRVERLKADMQQEIRFKDALIEAMGMGATTGNVARLADAIEAAELAEERLPFHLASELRRKRDEMTRELRVMKARAMIELQDMENHA
jgi:hypothetical protein